jgi:eukaryotic-like serine/threonine-protein kinase
MNDPNLNRQLGPYRLLRVVGRGGMGTVYAARNETTEQLAAVKLLSPLLATDVSFRERFIVEVESLKKLRHPNIVQLYGYGEQEGQLFYAMELIEGSNLQEELRQGHRFSWREATKIGIEICAALKHAHDHGIIHRDLKPANLLYTQDERIKLLDFGIAKLFGNTSVTTGSVMGTADYMAPEQAEGKAVTPRTDLYSLGSVLYALLAGRPPFLGKSVPEVVHKVRFESPIPICRMANDVPIELEQFIDQLLDKNPSKRIPTALAASHRLKAMEHALSVRQEEEDVSPDDVETSVAKPPASDQTSLDHVSSDVTVRMEGDSDSDADVQSVTVITRDSEATAGPDHFTTVEQEAAERDRRPVPWQTLGSAALLAALLLAGYQTVRVLLRTPSADRLYDQISAAWADENPRDLSEVEREMKLFQDHYARDPRQPEVAALQEELQQYRLQRRLEVRSRQPGRGGESPLEQLYLEYVRQRRSNPDQAYAQLLALVQLYDGVSLDDPDQAQYLDLARDQLAKLNATYAEQARLHRPLIEARLQAAQQTDDRELAARIYASIVELYGSKPWAADLVAEAARGLPPNGDANAVN